jgi:steroid delta-isomerase-like uncharacterized protein
MAGVSKQIQLFSRYAYRRAKPSAPTVAPRKIAITTLEPGPHLMPTNPTEILIARYYDAFNRGDSDGMLACLTNDVVHDVNQGERRNGKEAFRAFNARMAHCYKEKLANIVIMATPDGARGAAEFNVIGTYKNTDEGLPPAMGQTYVLPAGAFFALKDGQIARVSNYYNLTEWLMQVAGK